MYEYYETRRALLTWRAEPEASPGSRMKGLPECVDVVRAKLLE